MYYRWLIAFLLVYTINTTGQTTENSAVDNSIILQGVIIDGDTIPHINLREVEVIGKATRKYRRQNAEYQKLVYNIKKTLPYARAAAYRLNIVNAHLLTLKTENERKQYLKSVEKELFKEFETPLRKLTFTQGRILINLIDRETGDTSFNLVKEYRGGVSAFFWQSLARVFGANLKDEFDETGDDELIDMIVKQIDAGLL